MFMIIIGDSFCFFNFEKILEQNNILSHSIISLNNSQFITNYPQMEFMPFTEVKLDNQFSGLLSTIKFFKVGILALCFNNGTIQFYNETTSKKILEYKVCFI